MGGIKTSAITYRRGIPNTSTNFFFVAQANYAIPSPVNKFNANNVRIVAPSGPPTPFLTTFSFTTGPDTTSSDATLTSSSYNNLKSTLVRVIIGSTCTSIDANCFNGCTLLANVTIPNSVTSLGSNCFQLCVFSSITIPNSVTSLGSASFFQCGNLAIVNVPDSVTTIGASCFQSCTALTSITIPNSVTSIPDGIVQGCTSLSSFTVPSSVTSIGIYGFYQCTNLRSFIFTNPLTINTNLIDTLIGTNNVVVTFNKTSAWANLNSFVKNYFTQPPTYPASGMSYLFNP